MPSYASFNPLKYDKRVAGNDEADNLDSRSDWDVRRERPRFSDKAHRIAFQSRHTRRGSVWPIHDLILNDLLVWLLPTHFFTHLVKNVVILLIYLFGMRIAVLNGRNEGEAMSMMVLNANGFAVQIPRQSLPFILLWTLLFILWLVYNRRILYYLFWYSFPFHMNPYVTSHRRRPMRSQLCRFAVNEATARRNAVRPALYPYPTKIDNVFCLDALSDWKFRLFATPEEALQVAASTILPEETKDEEEETWKAVRIPSHWTLPPPSANSTASSAVHDTPIYTNIQYPFRPIAPPLVPTDRNPTGVYHVTLTWPWKDDEDDGVEYALLLHGIESACYVFWNDAYIGFTKDSRLLSEFRIPPHDKREPQHQLRLVVVKWCDGTYVEDQDHWYLSGIHRSVEIVRRPAGADLLDFQLQADANGRFECCVEYRRRPAASRTIVARIYSDQQLSANGDQWEPGVCIWEMRRWVDADDVVKSSRDGVTGTIHFADTLSGIQPWSAEVPNLYTLTITLYDVVDDTKQEADEQRWLCRQSESCRIGFRTVDIVAPGVVTINGHPVRAFAGINRHEHDPDHGKVVSMERMQQDLCLLKQNNFNLVRTSHYPNHPSFYKLTDFYGLYVWDEANIEVHGMKPMGRLAHDFGWRSTFLSRITRMVHRDRNHASVVFWSLGNEAGRGRNLFDARKIVKRLDPSRPVVYESGGALAEGTGRTELTDIICTMYPVLPRVKRLATRRDEDRPIILCEYSHSMGNSNGNLHYYWNAFWDESMPRLQGGCIWDMIDEGIRVPGDPSKASQRPYFAYGGDFNEPIHDAQFCINGMFSPDREPHPSVSEIRYLQQPVQISPSPGHGGAHINEAGSLVVNINAKKADVSAMLHFWNLYTFLDLSHLTWSWELKSNRSVDAIRSGQFTVPKLGGPIRLSLNDVVTRVRSLERSRPPNSGNTYWMNIRGRLKGNTSWADAGHIVVRQQFCVDIQLNDEVWCPVKSSMLNVSHPPALKVKSNDSGNSIDVYRGAPDDDLSLQVLVRIDKGTGALTLYAPHGKNLFTGGQALEPSFVRAVTDNDRGGLELALNFLLIPSWAQRIWYTLYGFHKCSYASHWKFVGLDAAMPPKMLCSRVRVIDSSTTDSLGIVALCSIVAPLTNVALLKIKLHYTIYSDGRVRISNHVNAMRPLRRTPSLPRVGMKMILDPSLHRIQYYGRGPMENYPDRKSAAEMGVYQATPYQMAYHGYVVPGENGSRSDCEYAAFRCGNGDGVGVAMTQPNGNIGTFAFSALPFSISELNAAMHTCDLPDRSDEGQHEIHVNLDHALMGLGGDTSWFPGVYDEFLVRPNQDFHYHLWLLPLRKSDDVSIVTRGFW